MTGFFEDDDKLTYPQADRLVGEYVAEKGEQRAQATSREVLEWAAVPDTAHNQRRVHDALTRLCDPLDANWAGRTVFELPNEVNDS